MSGIFCKFCWEHQAIFTGGPGRKFPLQDRQWVLDMVHYPLRINVTDVEAGIQVGTYQSPFDIHLAEGEKQQLDRCAR